MPSDMRIAVLPIDSRPCNTQFIDRLVTWAGGVCLLPSVFSLDHFRRPAAYADSMAFLQSALPACDAAVISLEHWCFGSLLASREEQVTASVALQRVEELRSLLAAHPHVPVYLSTVILRSSISTLRREDLSAYHAMTDYSVYTDRYDCLGLAEDRQKALEAEKRIPPAVLQKALRVRQRNLQLNLAAVEMAAAGQIASLSILQEDSQIYGLPKKDQRQILRQIQALGARNAYLRNGTDEAGAVCAAQALWAGRAPLKADIQYLGQADFIAPYEDRPFRQNLESACRQIGLTEEAGSDTVICVCCPEHGEQQEATHPASPQYLAVCADRIDALLAAGKRVYLLDIARANGGSPPLLRALRHADALSGYSAWNTASNAMGTLLAQVVSDALRGASNRRFFHERLLDDLVYQAALRHALQEQLTTLGEDIFALRDHARAEQLLRELYRQRLPALWPLREPPAYAVSLPWDRTFEIKAEIMTTEEEH